MFGDGLLAGILRKGKPNYCEVVKIQNGLSKIRHYSTYGGRPSETTFPSKILVFHNLTKEGDRFVWYQPRFNSHDLSFIHASKLDWNDEDLSMARVKNRSS